jgi:GT2 family glycosyltransferase
MLIKPAHETLRQPLHFVQANPYHDFMNSTDRNLRPGQPQDSNCGCVRCRVSVIIPTYNYGIFIRDALNSVLRQGISDLEIIVVDDGSTDGTADILGPFEARIKYVYQKNAGLSAARNTGIANSTGEFIQFLDADDILGPNALASQLRYLERHPKAHITVCRNRLFEETTPDGHPVFFGSWKLSHGNLDLHLCHLNIAPPHAFLSRREAIVETGWFDTQLMACEDYDFWLRAAVKGFVPHYNPFGVVYYRRHKESMSANLPTQYFFDHIIQKRLFELLDEDPQFPVGRRLEGLMAFSSGALLTASRLHRHHPEGARALMELALERIQDAREIASAERSAWNILTKLYCFKTLAFLFLPCFRHSSAAAAIRDNVTEILATVKAPHSKIGILAEILISASSGPREYLWERRQIRSLPLAYFRNRFFLPEAP